MESGTRMRLLPELTSEVLASGIVFVVDPFWGWWVKVGLRCSKAKRVVAHPHCQTDVEDVRRNDPILIHQAASCQL